MIDDKIGTEGAISLSETLLLNTTLKSMDLGRKKEETNRKKGMTTERQ